MDGNLWAQDVTLHDQLHHEPYVLKSQEHQNQCGDKEENICSPSVCPAVLVDKTTKMLKMSVFREKLYCTNGVFAFDKP